LTAIKSVLGDVLQKNHAQLLDRWLEKQRSSLTTKSGQADHVDVAEISRRLIGAFRDAVQTGQFEVLTAGPWQPVRDILDEFSRSRAQRSWSPTETAMLVFSLKEPLFELLRRECGRDADALAREIWLTTSVLDQLGLYTTEAFQKTREQTINRQQQELLELSTPVVRLWEGILAVPLIGTLDSERTQVVMESLLQTIVDTGSEIAIIDITGVPTVDTLVAQHLLKTVSAARLMGADCLISGIRPQIAQTIVHLGVQLDVISKATLADAFAVALKRIGKRVTSVAPAVDRPKPQANGESAAAQE
jgi:rsbT co-antagonist protein RsbR